MSKQSIREEMRRRAAAFLASGRAEEESARILAALEAKPEFEDADCILLYMALPDEVRTAPLLERWHGRKKLVLPRVRDKELDLCEYHPGTLHEGYRGILEPDPDAPKVHPDDIRLAVIPGVAFAFTGNADGSASVSRLGRGKGYYDRLLPHLRCPVIGICYPFRVLDTLPIDPWDQPLSRLIY